MKKQKSIYKNVVLLLAILFFISYTTHAQWYDPEKVNKKAYAIYEAAYKDAMDQNYMVAIANINKAIAIDPKFVEAYLSKAGIYAELKKYDSSVITISPIIKENWLGLLICNSFIGWLFLDFQKLI